MSNDYIFVYGTLRRDSGHEMARYLTENGDFIGTARLPGRLYRVAYYPAFVPSDEPCRQVVGEVYRLREAAAVLPFLDAYEECPAEGSQPTDYARLSLPVMLDNGDTLFAWVYVWKAPTEGLAEIVSGDFFLSGG